MKLLLSLEIPVPNHPINLEAPNTTKQLRGETAHEAPRGELPGEISQERGLGKAPGEIKDAPGAFPACDRAEKNQL